MKKKPNFSTSFWDDYKQTEKKSLYFPHSSLFAADLSQFYKWKPKCKIQMNFTYKQTNKQLSAYDLALGHYTEWNIYFLHTHKKINK